MMEEIKSKPIIKFNKNHLHNVRKAVGYDDVNKLKKDIKLLREWIKEQSHFLVKEFDDEYLERILIYGNGSLERTKQSFDWLCTCTNLMPEFLQNYDIKEEFRAVLNVLNICVTPIPTVDNYRLLIANCTGNDDSQFDLTKMFRYFIVIGHYMLNNDYCHGFKMIIDLRNITVGTVAKINPVVIHKALTILVETMNQNAKEIHMISGSKFFDTVLTLFKQGITDEMIQSIVVHPNVESLYKHMPRTQLPKDFGGDESSMKELSDSNFMEISSHEHIVKIKSMEGIATDKSYRLPSKFNENYFGIPGSFKSLSCLIRRSRHWPKIEKDGVCSTDKSKALKYKERNINLFHSNLYR